MPPAALRRPCTDTARPPRTCPDGRRSRSAPRSPRRSRGSPSPPRATTREPRSWMPRPAPPCGARAAPPARDCARRRSHRVQPRPVGAVADLPARVAQLVAQAVGRGEIACCPGRFAVLGELLELRGGPGSSSSRLSRPSRRASRAGVRRRRRPAPRRTHAWAAASARGVLKSSARASRKASRWTSSSGGESPRTRRRPASRNVLTRPAASASTSSPHGAGLR